MAAVAGLARLYLNYAPLLVKRACARAAEPVIVGTLCAIELLPVVKVK
jgi:hypothetical protein